MKMRKYMVYVDDGEEVYKVAVPAETEDDARAYVAGNGEIIALRDVTDSMTISAYDVQRALAEYGVDKLARDMIYRALVHTGIID